MFWITAIVVLTAFIILYAAKMVLYFDVVKKEFKNKVRGNFFQAPNIGLTMLALGCPDDTFDQSGLRAIWLTASVYQLSLVLFFYNRWMFSDEFLGNAAVTPYLLNVVGWFLLCNLGKAATVDIWLGVDVPTFFFGIGTLFCVIVYVDIFQNLNNGAVGRGHPAMFLLLAPPCVSCLSLSMLLGSWTLASKAIFGAMIFLLLLLLRSGQVIMKEPAFLGIYWAYVFPLAALATCGIANANAEKSDGAKVLAWILISISQAALLFVFCRMSFHCAMTASGRARWNDPLVDAPVSKPNTPGGADQNMTQVEPVWSQWWIHNP